MKLEYSVQLEDIIAFNNHHMEATPSIRRKLAVMRFVWAFAPLAAIWAITFFEGMDPSKAMWVITFVGVCISSPIFLFQPFYLRWMNNRQVRKAYEDEKNRSLLGDREIKVTSNGLAEKTASGENQSEYAQINRIDSDDNYTFIYAAKSKVHIIPKKSVKEGDYDAFVSELKKKTKVS